MALRPIADNGKVLHAAAVLGFDKEIIDIENGVKKSGTFNNICNDCDNVFFQDYENVDNIIQRPTNKMLAEIAVKNFLLQLSKCRFEMEFWNIMQQDYNAFENIKEIMNIKKIDYTEIESEVLFHKKIVEDNTSDCYHILVWKVLPYIIPIAMQGAIAVAKDIEGNDINNMDVSKRMQFLHLAILPVERASVVIAFYHKRDKLYRRLRHQINSISENEVLKYINYIIFKYTENYYISKKIEKEVFTNKSLQKLSQENDESPDLGILKLGNFWGIDYKPVDKDEIPNYLAEEWAIQ